MMIGGTSDHVHLVFKSRASQSLSDLMRMVKANSSKWVNERTETRGRFGWQSGFGAFSVSESQLQAVIRYVSNQETHHRKISFQEEYRALLIRHGVDYDERYL